MAERTSVSTWSYCVFYLALVVVFAWSSCSGFIADEDGKDNSGGKTDSGGETSGQSTAPDDSTDSVQCTAVCVEQLKIEGTDVPEDLTVELELDVDPTDHRRLFHCTDECEGFSEAACEEAEKIYCSETELTISLTTTEIYNVILNSDSFAQPVIFERANLTEGTNSVCGSSCDMFTINLDESKRTYSCEQTDKESACSEQEKLCDGEVVGGVLADECLDGSCEDTLEWSWRCN